MLNYHINISANLLILAFNIIVQIQFISIKIPKTKSMNNSYQRSPRNYRTQTRTYNRVANKRETPNTSSQFNFQSPNYKKKIVSRTTSGISMDKCRQVPQHINGVIELCANDKYQNKEEFDQVYLKEKQILDLLNEYHELGGEDEDDLTQEEIDALYGLTKEQLILMLIEVIKLYRKQYRRRNWVQNQLRMILGQQQQPLDLSQPYIGSIVKTIFDKFGYSSGGQEYRSRNCKDEKYTEPETTYGYTNRDVSPKARENRRNNGTRIYTQEAKQNEMVRQQSRPGLFPQAEQNKYTRNDTFGIGADIKGNRLRKMRTLQGNSDDTASHEFSNQVASKSYVGGIVPTSESINIQQKSKLRSRNKSPQQGLGGRRNKYSRQNGYDFRNGQEDNEQEMNSPIYSKKYKLLEEGPSQGQTSSHQIKKSEKYFRQNPQNGLQPGSASSYQYKRYEKNSKESPDNVGGNRYGKGYAQGYPGLLQLLKQGQQIRIETLNLLKLKQEDIGFEKDEIIKQLQSRMKKQDQQINYQARRKNYDM